MTAEQLTDRLDSLVAHCGSTELVAYMDRRDPQDVQTFLERLYEDLHWAVSELVDVRSDLQTWDKTGKHSHDDEESLRTRLLKSLRPLGYAASRETQVGGGSTDLLVELAKFSVRWIAECKVHSNYDALVEGILQLHSRYADGTQPDTAFLAFCFGQNASLVMTRWRNHLLKESICGLTGVRDGDRPLCFWSDHDHVGTGLPVRTMHLIVPLWYKPMDKSGKKARGEA